MRQNLEIKSSKHDALLNAALAGLLSLGVAGCQGDDSDKDDKASETEPALSILSKVEMPELTMESFQTDCQTRGGFVQSHAVCGGTNSCKGMSFNKYSKQLIEHTCKAMNTCGGMSCIDLPKDLGRSGAEIFEADCKGCHATPEGAFKVYVPAGTDLAKAAADFVQKNALIKTTIIAFGTQGVDADGLAFSNMPAFYQSHSRTEIERVFEHINSLTPIAEEYGVFGHE